MKEISVKALAKVNLGLDVVRKREDGYHEVRMIMQTIHLFDRLEITRNQSGRITMSTNLAFLPTNENNLVYKAAALLKEEFDIGDGIDESCISTFRWQPAWQAEARTLRPYYME